MSHSSNSEPDSNYLVVLNTCPDEAIAETIAETLVSQRLAACVNIFPKIRSIYSWQGNIERDNEVLLLIKTHKDQFQELQHIIQKLHPYELPEIVAVSLAAGSNDYLNWINQSVGHDFLNSK